jgi:hypothetical protein
MEVGQRVRLRALASRPGLNGAHARVIAAASAVEAAELARKGRLKCSTALADEVLSVALANVEPVEESEDESVLFSTSYFAVMRRTGRGYAWVARRFVPSGKVLLREAPIVVNCIADHLGDPLINEWRNELEPLTEHGECPPKASELFQRCAARIAERLHASLPAREQRRYMALADAFSPPTEKTIYNICALALTLALARGGHAHHLRDLGGLRPKPHGWTRTTRPAPWTPAHPLPPALDTLLHSRLAPRSRPQTGRTRSRGRIRRATPCTRC